MKTIVLFDTETNGYRGSSVLSLSIIKAKYDKSFEILDKETRFYYPKEGEAFNWDAHKIHGLTRDIIKQKRNGATYPIYYQEDTLLYDFLQGADIILAHNLSFDVSFFEPYKHFPKLKPVCSMEFNKNIVKAKRADGKIKTPKLLEMADYYDIKYNADELHGSEYDTLVLYKCVVAMEKKHNELFLRMIGEIK